MSHISEIPHELVRSIVLMVDDFGDYLNLILSNSIFKSSLEEKDVDECIKMKYPVRVEENTFCLNKKYWTLGGEKHGKYEECNALKGLAFFSKRSGTFYEGKRHGLWTMWDTVDALITTTDVPLKPGMCSDSTYYIHRQDVYEHGEHITRTFYTPDGDAMILPASWLT
jgi:hypothetical protein